jgi:hypothetical protein
MRHARRRVADLDPDPDRDHAVAGGDVDHGTVPDRRDTDADRAARQDDRRDGPPAACSGVSQTVYSTRRSVA